MESKSAVKVGILLLVGAALFGAAWWFLSHGLYSVGHYRLYAVFRDTRGLLKQTPVRMNGVAIGEVEDIRLLSELKPGDRKRMPADLLADPLNQLRPVVILAILKQYDKIPADSEVSVTSGLLIANPQVDIKPGTATQSLQANSVWRSDRVVEPQGMLASLSPEADRTLRNLNEALEKMTPQITLAMDRVQGILSRSDSIFANFEKASLAVQQLASDPKIRETLHVTMNDLQVVSHEARRAAQDMRLRLKRIVDSSQPKLDKLADTLLDSAEKFSDILDQTRSTLARLTEQVTDPRLHQSLLETVDLANSTIARFNQIASDIHNLTGDPTVQNDLKGALSSTKQTADKISQLTDKVGSLVNAIKPGTRPKLGIGTPEFSIDFFGRTNAPHFRSDVNMRIPIGGQNAFNLGLYDFAERYKLNAQYETDVAGVGALRYGIYASKLGVGFGWPNARGSKIRIDAYDPNNFKLDVRGYADLSRDFALWFGTDSLFKRTTPIFGIRLKR